MRCHVILRSVVLTFSFLLAVIACDSPTAPSNAKAARTSSVAALHPSLAAQLEHARRAPVALSDGALRIEAGVGPGALAGSFRPVGRAIRADLAARSGEPMRVGIEGGPEVLARARGLGDEPARREGNAVVYGDEHSPMASVLYAQGPVIEELFVVREPGADVGYDLTMPPGWSIHELAGDSATVELRDQHGRAAMRVSAARAWDRDGDELRVALQPDQGGVRVVVEPSADYPLLIDPTWTDATVPIKLRRRHTATLLANGDVLLVGGRTARGADDTAEIYDVRTGESSLLPMTEARARHSATLLSDGRVLVAGGFNGMDELGTSELFDPEVRAFIAGPDLLVASDDHTATLLDDGRVLLVGDGPSGAQIYDPAQGAFVATGSLVSAFDAAPAAALLDDGRVLVVGTVTALPAAQIFDPAGDGGVGTFSVTGGPSSLDPSGQTLTRLRDGRALLLGGCPCFSVGGPIFSSEVAELFDPAANGGVGAFVQTGDVNFARQGHTATLLPTGQVLVTGGTDLAPSAEQSNAEIFDPATGTFSVVADLMSDARGDHTATLLPTGDVLLVGGEQASAELYVAAGAAGSGTWTAHTDITAGRVYHTATTLMDGRVLFAGGELDFTAVPSESAELYDFGTASFELASQMVELRSRHTATLFPDGRVLLAGGLVGFTPTATSEIFDPGGGGAGSFDATGPLATARFHHTATLLPNGNVLIAGGSSTFFPTSPLASAELFDPSTGTFEATGTAMLGPMQGHGATLLPNGKVLLVGGNFAQIYDPLANSFSSAGALGTSHSEAELTVLPSGRVLVAGGSTLAAEIYDPLTESFAFTAGSATERINHAQVLLASGQAVLVGGHIEAIEPPILSGVEVFEPLGPQGGGFYALPSLSMSRTGHTATLLGSGDLLVVGGVPCIEPCFPQPLSNTEILRPVFAGVTWQPVLTTVPSTVEAGTSVTITGARFRGPETGGGASNASATNYPIAFWQPLEGSGFLEGVLTQWTDSEATWTVPSTAFTGPGRLRVAVNGVFSASRAVTITSAGLAVPCVFGADCASGFCADGVCCDALCVGDCEGCTAAKKGSGEDGVCGVVPAEQSPDDACVLSDGAPCTDADQCATGFCVDGVCCQSECGAQCEACDVDGSIGFCVPVSGAPHGERPACNPQAPEDLCDALVCDGVDRTQCAGTVGPCDPFACGADACFEVCESDDECAVGFHCEDGECIAGRCEGSLATTPEGQVIDCSPYKCQADGTCRNSCGDVSQCADPFACDFDGRCVPRPPPDDVAGCDCRMGGGPSPRDWVGPCALVLGFFVAWRRRRVRGSASQEAPRHASQGASRPERPQTSPGTLRVVGPVVGAERARPAASKVQYTADAQSRRRGILRIRLARAFLMVAVALWISPAVAQPGAPPPGAPPPAAPPAAPPPATPPPADKEEAKRHFDNGLKLVADQAWAPALAEFFESRRLHPTRAAMQNAAFCLRQLGRYDESLDLYEALLREFPTVEEAKKREVQQAISELRGLVGTIEIDAAEPGATIVIDGRQRGTYPPASPLRVAAGEHVVRVFKKGYEPFETRVDVAGRNVGRVDAKLVPLTESGTLKVTEESGKALAVFVDQIEVGVTPYEGPIDTGAHVVVLRGEGGVGVPPTAAPVEKDRTTTLELRAVKLDAVLRVEPVPAAALVMVNAVPVGRGTWEGSLPSGPHRIEVTADGFLGSRRQLDLGPGGPTIVKIPLERDESHDRWSIPSKITLEIGGAFGIFPHYFGDTTSECDEECSNGVGLGGLALLHAAYEFGNGFGVGLSGGYFSATQSTESRGASVQPVGLPPRDGRVDDRISVSGALVGAHASYHFGEVVPVLLRLGVGTLLGETKDERRGRFELDDGFTYQAGPVVQDPFSPFLYVDPEVRVGYPLTESFEVSVGFQALVFISLSRARWETDREVDAAVDGIGAFEEGDLTGPVWFVAAPGVSARYAF